MARPTSLSANLEEELTRYLKLGCYVETASAMCGIDRGTFAEWVKRGAREKARRQKHQDELDREAHYDKHQRQRKHRPEELQRLAKRKKENALTRRREEPYVKFHSSVERAMAQAELGDLATIAAAAKGGHIIEKRTIIDPKTKVETTVEKRTRPEWQAAAWRLERKNPKRWAQVRRVELSGDKDNPVALTLADAVKLAYSKKQTRMKSAEESNGARLPDQIIEGNGTALEPARRTNGTSNGTNGVPRWEEPDPDEDLDD